MTTERVPTANYSEYCPDGDGRFPDKKSGCKKFYECVHLNTEFASVVEKECPDGTLFDNTIDLCNWEADVVC